MATQHNTFIRKNGKFAIIITVTDWNDFKELEQFSKEENPDFLVSATTTKSIYSNMMPSVLISTYKARDITEGTRGMGIAGIMTEGCDSDRPEFEDLNGGLWAYRKAGLTIAEQFTQPKI